MKHTKGVQLFIQLLPFNSGLSLRLRRHLEECPECRNELASEEEARTAAIGRKDIGDIVDFWPGFSRSLEKARPEEAPAARVGWGWAVGIAALLAVTIAGLFFLFPSPSKDSLSSGVKLRVNFVRMYEQPAQAFIFQTQDANSTFVWVERPKPGGVR